MRPPIPAALAALALLAAPLETPAQASGAAGSTSRPNAAASSTQHPSTAVGSMPCDVRYVPAIGPACALPGGSFELARDRGTGLVVHGPDLRPARAIAESSEEPSQAGAATPSDPACVTGGSYLTEVIYAVPANRSSQATTRIPHIRELVREVNGRLMEEAAELGASRRYRILCGTGGEIVVRHEQLSVTTSVTDFNAVVTELTNRGYNDGTRKYWVWFDGTAGPGVLGTGHVYDNDSPGASNPNNGNGQAMFAVLWGDEAGVPAYESSTWMHEHAHTMGAVVSSAPNSSGNLHCIDDRDVMCYVDGGARATCCFQPNVCADREHFDCRHDDYFHPNPTSGYLTNHWNLGSTVNRFLDATGATMRFESASTSVAEDAGSATLTVLRSGSTAGAASVAYATSPGSASAGSDYATTSGTLSFADGVASRTISVPIVSDGATGEAAESFTVALSAPSGATLGAPSTATVTITESAGPPVVSFTSSAVTVAEGAASVAFPVSRSGSASGSVTVGYATSDQTATAGADYTATAGTLTFANGQTSASIVVPLRDDERFEAAETFAVTLSNPSAGASIGSPSVATATIAETDAQPTLALSAAAIEASEAGGPITMTVTRAGARDEAISVTLTTVSGTATAGIDFAPISATLDFGPGVVTRAVPLTIHDDAATETHETFVVELRSPTTPGRLGVPSATTVTILDDDGGLVTLASSSMTAPETHPVSIPISRSKTGAPAGVGWRLTPLSPAGPASTGTAVFGASQSSVTVSLHLDDSIATGDRTYSFGLESPQGASLGTPSALTLRVLDDEQAPRLGFVESSRSVQEDAGTLAIEVARSGDVSAAASVEVSLEAGSAVAGADLSAATGRLSFAPGQVQANVAVAIHDDSIAERAESATLRLRQPVGATLASAALPIEIRTSDQQPDVVVRGSAGAGAAGNGRYDDDPSTQSATSIAVRAIGGQGSFTIENDTNDTNRFAVRLDASDVVATIDGADVTSALTSPNGFEIDLVPLGNVVIEIRATPPAVELPGTVRDVAVTATWRGDGLRVDAALLRFVTL